MGRPFTRIAFTPSVREAQAHYGSRSPRSEAEANSGEPDALTEAEADFIEQMDGFYQATVNEDGWPYVQFRGGPRGFLRVLDAKTIAFADFRGNGQYISVGNINAAQRIALILMNQAAPARLKIWGTARVIDRSNDPAFIEALQVKGYTGRAERAIVIDVLAYDWNCPQHITPRFTRSEIREMNGPLLAEIEALRKRVPAPTAAGQASGAAGDSN
ncbi:pyridoxamine 5'-phosphate oxidase family protein [uncultured Ramlibacter sp.]|uniref:pyridoxamine 5'-phosphate oxidase family protein n=1 Tax=uncultured Ramlibacter sp. TaxID=260755 RepID=UPI00261FC865|nr:pyridoxamine 5'-phosphate oxidase family protein [uncultured Ramlibacter sp.]